MTGLGILKIVCWSYLIWNILGRIANFNHVDTNNLIARAIDNVVIVALMVLLYFLMK